MDDKVYRQIANLIWNIADDCLRDIYVRSKYRDVILPMTVIRRLDSVLEHARSVNIIDKLPFGNHSNLTLLEVGQAKIPKDTTKLFKKYLHGFTDNAQDILNKFKFYNQIETLTETGTLSSVIRQFTNPAINLSPNDIETKKGVILPAIDNHAMGTIFEHLIYMFSEANNEEAGEHFTPRDVVELLADLVIMPVAHLLKDNMRYSCYDGACGTGGMLTVAENRLRLYISKNKKTGIQLDLYGQEIQPETYAIAKADLLLSGGGEQAEQIRFGSTLSDDQFRGEAFHFMLSNPPYGKSWKTDREKLLVEKKNNRGKKKKEIVDERFIIDYKDHKRFDMTPRSSDGQMLFLLNNVSKMSDDPLGSRIAEIHNGSSLFTGDAGQGESNARRFLFEEDLVEAIIGIAGKTFLQYRHRNICMAFI